MQTKVILFLLIEVEFLIPFAILNIDYYFYIFPNFVPFTSLFTRFFMYVL